MNRTSTPHNSAAIAASLAHKWVQWLLYIFLAMAVLAAVAHLTLRHQRISATETQHICLPTGTTYPQLLDSLEANGCLQNRTVFKRLAKLRGLDGHVRPGCYKLEPGMGVVRVIHKLYSGSQDPVRVTINKHRTTQSLCDFLDKKLELCADSMLVRLNDPATAETYGYTVESFIGMFIQNTYEVYWTISPDELLERMKKESDRFWNSLRRGKLKDVGLTANEVLTLASIVEEETNQNDEKPLIASVYLNRLHKGMALQADPTVKFSVGDFAIRRVSGSMMDCDSPYNTYHHAGLPPGPICIPSVASIDAVLSGVKSDYLYFCAKEDFSGHHNFARTLDEHKANARRFHQALNKRGIGKNL